MKTYNIIASISTLAKATVKRLATITLLLAALTPLLLTSCQDDDDKKAKPKFELEYDFNRGQDKEGNEKFTDKKKYEEGATITIPEFTLSRDGFEYKGFAKSQTYKANDKKSFYQAGDKFTFDMEEPITLYAQWEKKKVASTVDTSSIVIQGFTIDEEVEEETSNTPSQPSTPSEVTYGVIYDFNGGTDANGKSNKKDTKKYKLGDEVTIGSVATTRQGYTLEGWSTDANVNDKSTIYQAGQKIKLEVENSTYLRLFAVWDKNSGSGEESEGETGGESGSTEEGSGGSEGGAVEDDDPNAPRFSVTYNFNGGKDFEGHEAITDTTTYKEGSIADIPQLLFSRTGYTFAGWSEKEAAENGDELQLAGGIVEINEAKNYTLYAQWYPIYYTLTYDYNGVMTKDGATAYLSANKYKYQDTTKILNIPLPRSGYTLLGWSKKSDYSAGDTLYNTGDSITFENPCSITLYAAWKKNEATKYKLIYDFNGGKSASGATSYVDPKMYETGELAAVSKDLTSMGITYRNHKLRGFSLIKDIDENKAVYTVGQQFKFSKSEDFTIYAQWEELGKNDKDYESKHKIIYDYQGGVDYDEDIAYVDDKGYYKDDKAVITDKTPSKKRNTFKGWSENKAASSSGTLYTAGSSYTFPGDNDVTLYAIYEKIVQPKDTGVVLSGGGAKGAYEVGVWKAMEEYDLVETVCAIAGTSVGGLNAALFSVLPAATSEELWKNEIGFQVILAPDMSSITDLGMSLVGFIQDTKSSYDSNKDKGDTSGSNPLLETLKGTGLDLVKNLLSFANDFAIKSDPMPGLFDRGPLRDIALANVSVDKIKASGLDLYATVIKRGMFITHLNGAKGSNAQYIYLNEQTNNDSLADILMATSAIPIAFPSQALVSPTKYQGSPIQPQWNCVDGGFEQVGGDNVPVNALTKSNRTKDKVKRLIVVYLKYDEKTTNANYIRTPKEEYGNKELIEVNPSQDLGNMVSGTLNFSADKITELVDLGYSDACKAFDRKGLEKVY